MNNIKDSFIDEVYYPTTHFYNGGNTVSLKEKLISLDLDYKKLNKIYTKFYSHTNLSSKLTLDSCIDIIVASTLARVNNWVMAFGSDGRWTILKPYK